MKSLIKKLFPRLTEWMYWNIKRRNTLDPSWGSHLPVLMTLMEHTEGTVVEMGTGLFSTPYLHFACLRQKRMLYSIESVPKYYRMNKYFEHRQHFVDFVKEWNLVPQDPIGLLFIDLTPAPMRKEMARRFKDIADVIVLHDSQAEDVYRYNEIYPLFKYRYEYTKLSPNTVVVSNKVDVAQFFK